MAFRDLRAFCRALEARGQLHRVPTPVSAELELVEVAARVAQRGGPALLFERVEGASAPVLVGALATAERLALGLGVERLDDLGERLAEVLGLARGSARGIGGAVRAVGGLTRLGRAAPHRVDVGPCQQVVERSPSLADLPVPRCWPGDGGHVISMPLVVTRDGRGQPRLGTGRMQIFDERTASIRLPGRGATGADGRIPVAVAIGVDPATLLASIAPLPLELDPFLFAGLLRRAPVELVACKTSDLEVPATAEYVLEGYVEPGETRPAGPFGAETGYYAAVEPAPVFHLTGLTRRRDPMYPTAIGGRGASDERWLAKASERLLLPLVRLLYPEVVDVNAPLEGGLRNLLLVSIRAEYPGQAQKVIAGLFGLAPALPAKAIVVFDQEVDVHDLAACAWRTTHNVDWRRDVVVIDGPLDPLDHAAPRARVGAKIGLDATRKVEDERHPRPWPADVEMTPEVRALVDRKWASYGIPLQ